MENKPLCPCGNIAITTIVQIPACQGCHNEYAEEGKKYLPIDERTFYKSFVYKSKKLAYPNAPEWFLNSI